MPTVESTRSTIVDVRRDRRGPGSWAGQPRGLSVCVLEQLHTLTLLAPDRRNLLKFAGRESACLPPNPQPALAQAGRSRAALPWPKTRGA